MRHQAIGAWMVSLCQIEEARAPSPCRTRAATPSGTCPPWTSRWRWPWSVSLTDSTSWRMTLTRVSPGPRPFVIAGGAEQANAMVGQRAFELGAGVALGHVDHSPGEVGQQFPLNVKQVGHHPPLVDLRVGQYEGDGQPGRGADQMQLQAPEVAGARGAKPVAGPTGKAGRLPVEYRDRGLAADHGQAWCYIASSYCELGSSRRASLQAFFKRQR